MELGGMLELEEMLESGRTLESESDFFLTFRSLESKKV